MNNGFLFREVLNEIFPKDNISIRILTDNKSLVQTVSVLTVVEDKRLRIDIASLRETVQRIIGFLEKKQKELQRIAEMEADDRKRGRAESKQKKSRPYNSPLRVKERLKYVKRKLEQWDHNKLNIHTKFIMGARANKALGLPAARGRIYRKHPELFKYAGDKDDRKWMVDNQCMEGRRKNAYIMIADQVLELLEETEYKDSPHAIPEKMQFFNLPQFCINKMKEFMIEKKQKWDIPRNYIYNDGGFLSTNE